MKKFQNWIYELQHKKPEAYFFICGDFNTNK